jgi:polar amino acid transport system substrate-binding protein
MGALFMDPKRFIILAGMIVMVCSASSLAAAAEVFKAALMGDMEPFVFAEGDAFNGVYPKVMQELARRIGLEIELVQCPAKRCELWMQSGKADMIIGMRDTPERKVYVEFLTVPHRVGSTRVFYLLRGNGSRLQRYEDLYGLRIGVELGTRYFEPFDSDPKITREEAPLQELNFQKLLKGRVDAVLTPEDRGEYYLSKLGIRDKVERAAYVYKDSLPRYIGISRKSPLMTRYDQLNKAMRDMVESGSLERIYDDYYFKRYAIPPGSFHIR